MKRAAFESLLIVFGLLLAYGLNEWRESRIAEEKLHEARALVIEELKFNRDTLAKPEFLPHHRQLLERYQRLAESDNPVGEPIFESGVHPAPLRDAAWRTLSTPEVIGRVSYRHIVALADLYQEQDRLERLHWTAVAWLLAPQPGKADADQQRARDRSIALYLADVVSTESRLLDRYDEAVKMLAESGDD